MNRIERSPVQEIQNRRFTEVEKLQSELEMALTHGVSSGDLTTVNHLRHQLEAKINLIKKDAPRLYGLYPDQPNLEALVTNHQAVVLPLTVGGQKVSEIRKAIRQIMNWPLDAYTNEMFYKHNLITLSQPQTFNLLFISLENLGFRYKPTLKRIHRHAQQLGLGLCPPEISPQLVIQSHLHLLDIFPQHRFYPCMEPYFDQEHHDPHIFLLYLNNGPTASKLLYNQSAIYSHYALPQTRWSLHSQFIFTITP